MTQPSWDVLVPVKRLDRAKSRLMVASGLRRELAQAMALDTVEAVLAGGRRVRLHAITDDVLLAERLVAMGPQVHVRTGAPRGLNAAIAFGERALGGVDPGRGVAVICGDLPVLRPQDVADVLCRASDVPRSVVGDRSGTGSTFLAVLGAQPLRPQFGCDSMCRHVADGAVPLNASPGVRADVDDVDDLLVAVGLGVAHRTAAVLTDWGYP